MESLSRNLNDKVGERGILYKEECFGRTVQNSRGSLCTRALSHAGWTVALQACANYLRIMFFLTSSCRECTTETRLGEEKNDTTPLILRTSISCHLWRAGRRSPFYGLQRGEPFADMLYAFDFYISPARTERNRTEKVAASSTVVNKRVKKARILEARARLHGDRFILTRN